MNKPWLAIGLAVIAACCLAGSMFSNRWLVPDYGDDDGFSPRSFQMCVYDQDRSPVSCKGGGNGEVIEAIDRSAGGSPPTSPMFVPSGTLAFFAAFIAAAALLAAAVLAFSRQAVKLPVTIATLAIIVGALAAALFLGTRPGTSPIAGGPFKAGYAGLVFAAGVVGGMVAARKLGRVVVKAATPAPGSAKPKARRRGKR